MLFSLPVAFATILFVLTMGLLPIVDPDFFWHVKIGALIRQAGEIPSVEVFSHTAEGQAWVVQGWFSDVVLDYVWQSAGIVGIRLLVASLVVLTWALVYRTIRLYAARAETALILSIFAVALMAPFVGPRPTMATMLGLALTLYGLLAFRRSGELRWLLILPPVFGIWPNLHFGYIAGLGLVGLFALSELLARAVPIAREHRENGTLFARGPALIGFLCAAAIGANPHGYGVLWETVQMSVQGATSTVSEWQSPSFAILPGKLVYLAISVFVIARAFARQSIHWLDIVVPLAVIAAALSAWRNVPLMGIVLMPFVARALSNWEKGIFVIPQRSVRGVGAAVTHDMSPRASALVNMALVACAVVGTVFLAPLADRKFGEMHALYQPSGATDFLAAHDLKGRLFNTYNAGGYLIYRLYPKQRVFIDGRYNPYPRQVIDDYDTIVDGGPRWFVKLQSYEIDIVLSETHVHFRQLLLLRPEFRLVYEDPYFSVLIRDIDRFRSLATVEPSLEAAARPR